MKYNRKYLMPLTEIERIGKRVTFMSEIKRNPNETLTINEKVNWRISRAVRQKLSVMGIDIVDENNVKLFLEGGEKIKCYIILYYF